MSALSYDAVKPGTGRHARPVTGADRAHDIASSNTTSHIRRVPKHCGCACCALRLPHLRRRELVDVLGSEAV